VYLAGSLSLLAPMAANTRKGSMPNLLAIRPTSRPSRFGPSVLSFARNASISFLNSDEYEFVFASIISLLRLFD